MAVVVWPVCFEGFRQHCWVFSRTRGLRLRSTSKGSKRCVAELELDCAPKIEHRYSLQILCRLVVLIANLIYSSQIQHLMGREVTTVERMQCGAFSGLVAQTVTYPIEVTRRRMQTIGLVGLRNDTALTSLGCSSIRPTFQSPPSLWSTVQFLYAEQGMRGFLKGVSMNWMKGPVAFSISFTTFDMVKQLMEPPSQ
jgi:Mitochondrial carrier protein